MKKLLIVLSLVLLAGMLTACKKGGDTEEDKSKPVINGAEVILLEPGQTYDPMVGITATDEKDGNLTSEILYDASGVDPYKWGTYYITYQVTNSDGVTTYVDRQVVVGEYASGTYSLKHYPTDVKYAFFGAAEKYLLETLTGGVPITGNATFTLFSDRMQLKFPNHDNIMGYGIQFSDMSDFDDEVLMDDGEAGEDDEKTYRVAWNTAPTTFNQWISDDATSSDIITLVQDGLFEFVPTTVDHEETPVDESEFGYGLLPSMAADFPTPIEYDDEGNAQVITEPGMLSYNPELLVSNIWRIQIRDGLEWKFHPNTDTTGLDTDITAEDFIETYKRALKDGWFRAISGGGDFLNSSHEIVGAQAYYDDWQDDTIPEDEKTPWEDVGIRLIGDDTIEIETTDPLSQWNIMYWFGGETLTPIHLGLYDQLWSEDNETNSYGTSPETTAYHGIYYLDYYETDKMVRLKKNNSFHNKDLYNFTGMNISIIEDTEIRFQEFVDGKLDTIGVPATKYEDYKNELLYAPGPTTFRMAINGLGTVERQREQFPDSTFVPEPILAERDFKKAMYFAIDRQSLADDVIKTVDPMMYQFSSAYIVDASTFTPWRETPQAGLVGENLSPDTMGYNEDLAKSYFNAAVEKLVARGVYEENEEIELLFTIQSASTNMELLGQYIKEQFEELFVHDELGVSIKVEVNPQTFPDNYYNFILIGNTDMGMGGISGSELDAASYLDVYCSDNRGYFTMDWGIDTSVPEIPVTYTIDGVEHHEMWSFDAIVSALNKEVTVVNGKEVSE